MVQFVTRYRAKMAEQGQPMIELSSAAHLQGQKYISLVTFRRNGQLVQTPVWFAEQAGQLYVMTRNDSGKFKRIRNQPQVRLAACTARGKVTGAWIDGQARILDRAEEGAARQALARKYFLMRFPWLWSRKNIFLGITLRPA
jgi:uncharacterized protein